MKNLKFVYIIVIAVLATASSKAYTRIDDTYTRDLSVFSDIPTVTTTQGLFQTTAGDLGWTGHRFCNQGPQGYYVCRFSSSDIVWYDDSRTHYYLNGCLNKVVLLDQQVQQADAQCDTAPVQQQASSGFDWSCVGNLIDTVASGFGSYQQGGQGYGYQQSYTPVVHEREYIHDQPQQAPSINVYTKVENKVYVGGAVASATPCPQPRPQPSATPCYNTTSASSGNLTGSMVYDVNGNPVTAAHKGTVATTARQLKNQRQQALALNRSGSAKPVNQDRLGAQNQPTRRLVVNTAKPVTARQVDRPRMIRQPAQPTVARTAFRQPQVVRNTPRFNNVSRIQSRPQNSFKMQGNRGNQQHFAPASVRQSRPNMGNFQRQGGGGHRGKR